MIADVEWILITHLLDALARHFSSIRAILRDGELHTAYVADLLFIEAEDAESE